MNNEGRDLPSSAWVKVAERQLDILMEQRKQAASAQIEYGKWLIATISICHLGGIATIAGADKGTITDPKVAVASLAAGLMFIFASGFSAWINFSLIMDLLDSWLRPSLIANPDHKFEKPWWHWMIATAKWISIAFGILSVLMVPVAVWAAFHTPT